jgi:rieske iron-sulfur protein
MKSHHKKNALSSCFEPPEKGERVVSEKDDICTCLTPLQGRRTVLKAVLGLRLSLPFLDVAAAQTADPKKARPQEGDRFVFLSGEKEGDLITPADLPLGGPAMLTYPMDPQANVVRDGSRLNQVFLVRLDAAELTEATRARAAEGIVAYSAFCTHQGCPVSDWEEQTKTIKCVCHWAEYDPKDGARVIAGPAPRRLAALPLKIVDGVLMAAGGFVGHVGIKRR